MVYRIYEWSDEIEILDNFIYLDNMDEFKMTRIGFVGQDECDVFEYGFGFNYSGIKSEEELCYKHRDFFKTQEEAEHFLRMSNSKVYEEHSDFNYCIEKLFNHAKEISELSPYDIVNNSQLSTISIKAIRETIDANIKYIQVGKAVEWLINERGYIESYDCYSDVNEILEDYNNRKEK